MADSTYAPRSTISVETCTVCGVLFVARCGAGRAKYCSKKCVKTASNATPASRAARQRYRAKHNGGDPRHSIICEMCGVEALVTKASGRFCDVGCVALWKLEHNAHGHRPRQRSSSTALVHLGSAEDFPDPRDLAERHCRYCAKQFLAQRRSTRQYCDSECAKSFKKYGRARRWDDGRNWVLLVSGPCGWCRKNFTGQATCVERAPQYCSKRCSMAASKYRHGRFIVPDPVRQQIYQRDKFTCQLCKEPVDMTLGSSDVWGATLDHKVPQSHQLIPDHSPGNLRLAHRWCNSVRGDLSMYDDAFFVA